jgi:hypothetical protein
VTADNLLREDIEGWCWVHHTRNKYGKTDRQRERKKKRQTERQRERERETGIAFLHESK